MGLGTERQVDDCEGKMSRQIEVDGVMHPAGERQRLRVDKVLRVPRNGGCWGCPLVEDGGPVVFCIADGHRRRPGCHGRPEWRPLSRGRVIVQLEDR